jgi:hypothetical protein
MSMRTETFTAPPSALRYMLQAFRPKPRWDSSRGIPALCITWRGFLFARDALHSIGNITGNEDAAPGGVLSLLAPHILGFRLLMAMLTHPLWPLPIWQALQVRNRLMLRGPIQIGDTFDLIADVAGWRVLEKGMEADLRLRLQQGDQCVWESIVTFYYRGRFGTTTAHGVACGAAPVSPAPDATYTTCAQWRIDNSGRWRFGALTGDYNGIHQSGWYARRFGFSAAFAHPQRVAAQCLAHLSAPGPAPQQLDLWIKGPVYYDEEVVLRRSPRDGHTGHDFALWIAGDARPALVGSWHNRISP